ncbi:uncharacterized protein LOC133174446 [Saccostrea echinata]|uniref:uncharacterized protein LOC133174446 n=1 Tax=Saccostrea echinata TaxID=191078 RepID=UPI002A7F54C2|nr:uncharacterized protein LOC133174446 [Saccostrea echinata]
MRVPKAKLRKATTAASHYEGGKAAYTLTSKLAVLIFSTEELAQSRGQGIRDAKKGDIRPVLDHDKLDVLKEYVNTWCQKNGKGKMEDKFFNDAVTERISYSRKLMKKIQKK